MLCNAKGNQYRAWAYTDMSVGIITYLCVLGYVFHLEEQINSNGLVAVTQKKLVKPLTLLACFIIRPFGTWLLNTEIYSASNSWGISILYDTKSLTEDGKGNMWPTSTSGLDFLNCLVLFSLSFARIFILTISAF